MGEFCVGLRLCLTVLMWRSNFVGSVWGCGCTWLCIDVGRDWMSSVLGLRLCLTVY